MNFLCLPGGEKGKLWSSGIFGFEKLQILGFFKVVFEVSSLELAETRRFSRLCSGSLLTWPSPRVLGNYWLCPVKASEPTTLGSKWTLQGIWTAHHHPKWVKVEQSSFSTAQLAVGCPATEVASATVPLFAHSCLLHESTKHISSKEFFVIIPLMFWGVACQASGYSSPKHPITLPAPGLLGHKWEMVPGPTLDLPTVRISVALLYWAKRARQNASKCQRTNFRPSAPKQNDLVIVLVYRLVHWMLRNAECH